MAKLTKEMAWDQVNALIQYTFEQAKKPGAAHDWARTAIKTHDYPEMAREQYYSIPLEVFTQHLPQFYAEVSEVDKQQAYLYNSQCCRLVNIVVPEDEDEH
jgi:hypothetical protein